MSPSKARHDSHPAHARPLTHPEIRTIVLGIMLAMFLGALDQTIVATALPTIGRHFGDLGDLSWVVTAYLLTGTASTPLYGKLSDIHGRRVMMLIAITLFVAGSLSCALAPSMTALVLSRALQGMGGGGLMALSQTIIADIVSPRERGRYQGYIAAVFATSSVGGPVLGGFLTQHIDWSLIFWINLPLGLAALGMTSNVLRRVPFHPRKHRLDVIGALLMVAAAVALLLALSWGGRKFDWISLETGALLATSAALWGLFGWRLTATDEPFLPLAVLGNPVVRSAALAGACTMATLVGMTIFVPLYFETVLHLSASQSGMALIPLMAATVAFSTICGRLMMHLVHYKRVPLIGNVVAILALIALAIWPAAMPTALVLLPAPGSAPCSRFPPSACRTQ
jgi:EmrB/QacA subfamily drug resistance transporter